MKVVVQRSKEASVSVEGNVVGSIEHGLVLLVGFTKGDSLNEINYLVDKIINLRIFDDDEGVMNKSLIDVNGDILSISQFTLYADTRKGRRPSYINALGGDDAIGLYRLFNDKGGITMADYQIFSDGACDIGFEKAAVSVSPSVVGASMPSYLFPYYEFSGWILN